MTAKLGFAAARNPHAAARGIDSVQFDHWIKPALGERMASQYSPHCHQAAPHDSVTINRFHGVLGARGHVAASRQENRRHSPLVSSKHEERDGFRNLTHRVPLHPQFPVIPSSEATRNLGLAVVCEKPRCFAVLGMTIISYLVRLSTDF